MTNVGLYVHIPFCRRKCAYCSFYSVACTDEMEEAYVRALREEIRLVGQKNSDVVVKTIYFGGGTPSVLRKKSLANVFESIYASFRVSPEEITIEVNPTSDDKLPFYKTLGVDRISVGFQSYDDRILKILGRLHTADEGKSTLENAASLFDNVSADIILGVQKYQNARDEFLSVAPYVKHISAYMLSVEEGTPLFHCVNEKSVSVATENEVVDQYNTFVNVARENGFIRYETSNFTLSGYRSKHNSSYWYLTPYVGVGCSAHSYINGERYYNSADISEYINGNHSGFGRQILERARNEREDKAEFVMLGLRTTDGIDLAKYKDRFGAEFSDDFAQGIINAEEYVQTVDGFFRILPQYFLLQNRVISEILG